MAICFDDIDLSCQECYRVTRTDCAPFTLPLGLTPSDEVYVVVVDKNGVQASVQEIVDENGSVTIFPNSFGGISKYGGEYTVVISLTEIPVPESLSISSNTYNCLLFNFESGDKFCGCEEGSNLLINGSFDEGPAGTFQGTDVNPSLGDTLGWTLEYTEGLVRIVNEGGVHRFEQLPGEFAAFQYWNDMILPLGNYQIVVVASEITGQGATVTLATQGTFDLESVVVDNSGVLKSYVINFEVTTVSATSFFGFQVAPDFVAPYIHVYIDSITVRSL